MNSVIDIADETNLDEIQDILDYRFHSRSLLIRALTRSQYAKEKHDKLEKCDDQLLLATLGDAILKAALTDILFESGCETREDMTRKRENMESGNALAKRAKDLGIERFILLGRGEEKQEVQEGESVLAETLEALIGAIHLDSGYDNTKKVVARLFDI